MLNKFYITVVFALVMGGSSFLSTAKSQSVDNTIDTISLQQGDGFSELRKLIASNFDFTNSDYKEGIVNSEVRFSLNEKGEIKDVVVNGDCKNVSKEIETVMNNLHSKFKANPNFAYVMPVQVAIANR